MGIGCRGGVAAGCRGAVARLEGAWSKGLANVGCTNIGGTIGRGQASVNQSALGGCGLNREKASDTRTEDAAIAPARAA